MASRDDQYECPHCFHRFNHKSSLIRHQKRCIQGLKTPSRQKACKNCSKAKLGCDLLRPRCSRCQARSLICEFVSGDSTTSGQDLADIVRLQDGDESLSISAERVHESSPSIRLYENFSTRNTSNEHTSATIVADTEPPDTLSYTPDIASELTISNQRREVLLGTATSTPNSDHVARRTMHFVLRVLKSWPRLMAVHHTNHLPPVIHKLQLENGIPKPLVNCYTLVKMWDGHADGSRKLVQDTILLEVQRLLREYPLYNEIDLLATAQSLLVLITILFFGMGQEPALNHPLDAHLLINVWDVKHSLAETGLFLEQESTHSLPAWRQWAIVSAKRRTILALHHLEWAWSLLHGYPILSCFELGPLPAPAAKYLWQETDEKKWEHLYQKWLWQWKHSSYKMIEFFHISPEASLDARSEMWLAEADEFGMMLMAEAMQNDFFYRRNEWYPMVKDIQSERGALTRINQSEPINVEPKITGIIFWQHLWEDFNRTALGTVILAIRSISCREEIKDHLG